MASKKMVYPNRIHFGQIIFCSPYYMTNDKHDSLYYKKVQPFKTFVNFEIVLVSLM